MPALGEAGAFLFPGRVAVREGSQVRVFEQKPEGGEGVWRKEYSRQVQEKLQVERS